MNRPAHRSFESVTRSLKLRWVHLDSPACYRPQGSPLVCVWQVKLLRSQLRTLTGSRGDVAAQARGLKHRVSRVSTCHANLRTCCEDMVRCWPSQRCVTYSVCHLGLLTWVQRLFGKQLGDVSAMIVSSLNSRFTSQLAVGKQGVLVERLKAEIQALHASISARDEALTLAQVRLTLLFREFVLSFGLLTSQSLSSEALNRKQIEIDELARKLEASQASLDHSGKQYAVILPPSS